MSTMEERLNSRIAALTVKVEEAEAMKGSGEAVMTLHKVFAKVGQVMSADIIGTASILQGIEGAEHFTQSLQAITAALGTSSGADRAEGEEQAKYLTNAVESGLLEGDERDKVEALLKRWRESSPKGGGSSTSSSGSNKPAGRALPFPVKVTCEADGWSARQTGNVNSLRWAAISHHGDKHGGKPAKGDPIHTGLTEAILSVCDEKSQSAQGGGYLVDRTA